MLIIETMILFAMPDQARAPFLKPQKQVVVCFKKMDNSNTMDRWSANILLDHNNDYTLVTDTATNLLQTVSRRTVDNKVCGFHSSEDCHGKLLTFPKEGTQY